jgi:hypothetical protein
MAVSAPFTPSGNTVTFTAATSAPTPIQAVSTTLGGNQYRVLNAGSVTVFMGIGQTAAQATASATVVTSTANCIPILAGTDEILSFLPNAYFTGITGSSTAVVYITPGDGD